MKGKIWNKMNKKAQEEMIGFALIIIIVMVVMMVFLSLGKGNVKEDIENYEAENFL